MWLSLILVATNFALLLCLTEGGGKKDVPKKTTRRELLASSTSKSFRGHESEYLALVETCGDVEYETALYVDDHLYAIAVLKDDDKADTCPSFVAAHAIVSGISATENAKEILMWSSKDTAKAHFPAPSLPTGTFQFSELARAVEVAQPARLNSVYEAVSNNCADFIVDIASELEVTIDSKVVSFVAGRLLEDAGQEFVDSVRNSANYFSLFKGARSLRSEEIVTDQQLLERLVESKAMKLM
jgi:hypothetical protein